MKSIKRTLALLLAVIIMVGTVACGGAPVNTESDYRDNNNPDLESFAEFCDELFADIVTESTITLHSFVENPQAIGITDYPVQLGSTSLEGFDDTTELTNAINKLKTFNRDDLSTSQQIVYDMLLNTLNNSLEVSDLYLYGTTFTPTTGIQVQLPIVFAEYSFNKKKDIDEYITLVGQIYDYYVYIIEIEKMKAEKGLSMEDFAIDAIIENCDSFLADLDDNNFLISTFNQKVDEFQGLTEDERTKYKTDNAAAINNSLIPGYKYIISELAKLKGCCKYEGGLCNKPDGKKYYEYLMKDNLGWNLSIDEIDKLVDEYLAKAITDIQMLILSDKTLYDKLDSYKFEITEPEEILKDLKNKIAKDFPAGPDLPYTIKKIDKSLEDFASPAMYFLPPVDNPANNSIFINEAYLSDPVRMYTTLAHEGYPGHLYQTTYFNSNNNCNLRILIRPDGYSEGWASYCETYSYTFADTGSDKLNRIMADNYFAVLLIYAKADIGINYYGWDKNKLKTFLAGYGYGTDEIVDSIYETMVTEPCIYPSYSVGCLAFIRMREKAMNELGDKYNAKDFHKFIMDMGPMDLDLLENYFNKWLKSQK